MRVFEVPEPVGPWVTVLVYLPRNRFTAELPERVADAVARAYGADRRTFEPHVGASSLARIAVSVRRADRRRPVDLDALERTIDELSTSWPDRLRAVLVAEVGEDAGRAAVRPRRRATLRPPTARRCRRSGPISDVRRIASSSPATTS